MRRDPRAYLWDALHAAELLGEFGAGKSFADYLRGVMFAMVGRRVGSRRCGIASWAIDQVADRQTRKSALLVVMIDTRARAPFRGR